MNTGRAHTREMGCQLGYAARSVKSSRPRSLVLASAAVAPSEAVAIDATTCGGRHVTNRGTPEDDLIVGTTRTDVIAGLEGNDVIDGMGGRDVLCGNGGADSLIGKRGPDRLFGGRGDDGLFGVFGDDWQWGGPGNDVMTSGGGDPGRDHLYGGPGHDALFNAGPGPDVLSGGDGDDFLRGPRGPTSSSAMPGTTCSTAIGTATDSGEVQARIGCMAATMMTGSSEERGRTSSSAAGVWMRWVVGPPSTSVSAGNGTAAVARAAAEHERQEWRASDCRRRS